MKWLDFWFLSSKSYGGDRLLNGFMNDQRQILSVWDHLGRGGLILQVHMSNPINVESVQSYNFRSNSRIWYRVWLIASICEIYKEAWHKVVLSLENT